MKWPARFERWLSLLLRRAGLMPRSTRADTDTMGEYKALMAAPDDVGPRPVPADPDEPHAALIRQVRFYAQNGARALSSLLDGEQVPDEVGDMWAMRSGRYVEFMDEESQWMGVPRSACWSGAESGALTNALVEATQLAAKNNGDTDAEYICSDILADVDPQGVLEVITAAYNRPWTVVDGEPMEMMTPDEERSRRAADVH